MGQRYPDVCLSPIQYTAGAARRQACAPTRQGTHYSRDVSRGNHASAHSGQTRAAARRREVQLAILRTLGLTTGQLRRLWLGEQAIVYAYGPAGGALLGAALATTTVTYLQLGDPATTNPSTFGTPPLLLAVSPSSLAWYYGPELMAALLGMLLTSGTLARANLDRALRLGED